MTQKKPNTTPQVVSGGPTPPGRGQPTTPKVPTDPKVTVLTMPLGQLQANVGEANRLIGQIGALLPGLFTLTVDDRKHSNGRFKDGESTGFYNVLDATEKFPQYFEELADKDEGYDPTRFEPERLRDRLQRRDELASVSTKLEGLAGPADDTVLHLGELTKPVLTEAYGIAKMHAKNNPAIRSLIAPLMDYYAAAARKAAETRAANKIIAEKAVAEAKKEPAK